MRYINFRNLKANYLIPVEVFFYELYKLNITPPLEIEDFPPSMAALAKKYPQEAIEFCNISKRPAGTYMLERNITINNMDIFVFHPLRYRPTVQHTHQFFEILFVVSGECKNIVDQTELSLKKGDICFLSPDAPHTLMIHRHDTIVYSIVVRTTTFERAFSNLYNKDDIISDFFAHALYTNSSHTTPFLLCHTDCEDSLLQLIEQIVNEQLNQEKFSDRIINIYFELFIAELLRRHEQHFTVGKAAKNVGKINITAMLRYIQDNYKTLTLPQAASFFNCSEAYFSRIIKKYTGQNFVDIIKKIKLKNATELLLEGNKAVSDIIEEIGYTDSSHFYKIFKTNYGMTPIQYKEAYKKDNEEMRYY